MTTEQQTAHQPQQDDGLPIMRTGQALRSMRDAGYNLSTALAEVIDNSLEAKANAVTVQIDSDDNEDVTRITVIDDGDGMDAKVLHHYLQIGFSTRYMKTDGIGKYGVGAKLAALNFGTKISVYSRTSAEAPWLRVHFDLNAAIAEEEKTGRFPTIPTPKPVMPPKRYNEVLPEGAGTVVIWAGIDRLQRGRVAMTAAELVNEVKQELSRIFREFINAGIDITVNETALKAHDPLFLMEDTWAEDVLNKHPDHRDASKAAGGLHFPATVIADEMVRVGPGEARLRVTLYPPEVTRKRFQGGDNLAVKLRIPDNQGQISIVRMNREIAYSTIPKMLPYGVKANDRFIGIEISFDARLDEYFGVRNVKRGVEPDGALRRRVHELLKRYIPQARKMLDARWGTASRKDKEHDGEHAGLLEAVKAANLVMPKSKARPVSEQKVREELLDLAEDVGHEKEDDKLAYIEKIKDLPFVLESVRFPGSQFIETTHLSHQVIIRLNTRHKFYKEIWRPLAEMSEADPAQLSGEDAVKTARRAVEGLSLMVVAYGKAQSMENDPTVYDNLTNQWGGFLETLMDKVRNVV